MLLFALFDNIVLVSYQHAQCSKFYLRFNDISFLWWKYGKSFQKHWAWNWAIWSFGHTGGNLGNRTLASPVRHSATQLSDIFAAIYAGICHRVRVGRAGGRPELTETLLEPAK